MQAQTLAKAVVAFASNIDNLGVLGPAVEKIAHRHVALVVTPELYSIVHSNLMLAIGEVLGDAVTPEIGEGWSNAVLALAEILTNAEEELYQKVEARKGGWRGMRDFEVTGIQKVAEDTVQFDFMPKDGSSTGIEFSPGQYLTIRLPSSDIAAPRHYTATSKADGSVAGLQCTTRLVSGANGNPAGEVSTYMHKKMQVGETVQLSAPVGVFTPGVADGGKVAFVTAGIGATPAHAW